MKKILVITDNGFLLQSFKKLLISGFRDYVSLFEFRKSSSSKTVKYYEEGIDILKEISVKDEYLNIIHDYFLVISLHCKQIFPLELVKSVRCINVHPGYNPVNRGWYPQVFSIINHTLIGATIHEMDEFIDHGKIICRQIVPVYSSDTSKDVYERVLAMEIQLLKDNLLSIIENTYTSFEPEKQNIFHTKEEFKQLCKLDLDENLTMREAIDKLRALTHGDYANAYFIDENDHKIYVKVCLSME